MNERLETATPHERRVARRLDARGEVGLADALLRLKGVTIGARFRIETLYAVGGEGAVYIVRDLTVPSAPPRVAKLALLPVHSPFSLTSKIIRKQRETLRAEAAFLEQSASPFLPLHHGTFAFDNPLLEAGRGDAFEEREPVYVMEKLPGSDLDRWLRRMHRSSVPRPVMRRTLDRVAVVLLQALVDLYDRGFFYADLRPGNLRMIGRPERRIRLLDAGSLVTRYDNAGRFPFVPAYLPPAEFQRVQKSKFIVISARTQAVMAGRTLFEVATGQAPRPGFSVDPKALVESNVSPVVADVVDGLCRGDFQHVRHALRYLARRAKRRVAGGNAPGPAASIQRAAARRTGARRGADGVPTGPISARERRSIWSKALERLRWLDRKRRPGA